MYKQMRDWMIYGYLDDKYDEFFIVCDTNAANANDDKQQTMLKSMTNSKPDELDTFIMNEIEEQAIENKFSSKNSQYALNSARLPSFINLKIANKILFTGDLLQLFKSKTLKEIYFTANDPNISQLAQNLSFIRLQNVFDSNKSKLSAIFYYFNPYLFN
jgi:hypothetical protein